MSRDGDSIVNTSTEILASKDPLREHRTWAAQAVEASRMICSGGC